jgi:exonuclease III
MEADRVARAARGGAKDRPHGEGGVAAGLPPPATSADREQSYNPNDSQPQKVQQDSRWSNRQESQPITKTLRDRFPESPLSFFLDASRDPLSGVIRNGANPTEPLEPQLQSRKKDPPHPAQFPRGLRKTMHIEIGFEGMQRTPRSLNNPHLNMGNLMQAHWRHGFVQMMIYCPALQDPVLHRTYLRLMQNGWLPAQKSKKLTPAYLQQRGKSSRPLSCLISLPTGVTQPWQTRPGRAYTPTWEYSSSSASKIETLDHRTSRWYLTRDQRNALARAYNGNTANEYISTNYPHNALPKISPEALQEHKKHTLTIYTHNCCTLQPNPVTMAKLMNLAPRTPDVVVLPETHHTANTVNDGKRLWRNHKMVLHAEKKSGKANASSGVAITTATAMAACKVVSHDPLGRHLALRIPLAHGRKLLLIGVYAPQKTDRQGRAMLTDQLIRLLEMAHNHRYSVIMSGDWNDVQEVGLDRTPPLENPNPPDPWFEDVLQNPHGITLYDAWRVHNPDRREYTYHHIGDSMKDRKDFTLVSSDLLAHVMWQTNALWPLQSKKGGHTALGMTINLDSFLEAKLETPARGPAPPTYLDHSQQQAWGQYKLTLANLKTKQWDGSPRAQYERLLTEATHAAEEAKVIVHPDDSPVSPHPYQSACTKRRVRIIHLCNEALHPGFATRHPATKMAILRDLQPLLLPHNRRGKERMIRRTAQAATYLPEMWKNQLPQLRREKAKLIKTAEAAARKKASDNFRDRIREKAETKPGHLLWHIKAASASPTAVAITKDGHCLTTIKELDHEAQQQLKPILAPPETTSPMGAPTTTPKHLTASQKQNRLAFQQVLAQFGPATSVAQRHKLEAIMNPITATDLRELLRKLKRSSYAPGMPMVLLKELPDSALHPITRIINAILANPLEMTEADLLAHLILLPKDDPHDLSLVRPITMCSALYKIVAFLLSSRVMQILETDSFLLPSNVGFTPHGETHHLIVAIQALFDVNQAMPEHERKHIHALLVDLSQAYDRVPWQALIQTLEHVGFPPLFRQWLLHALENTTVHLKFPQGLSKDPMKFKANRGIKQGCPLSPILFAIFNDTLLRWVASATPSQYLDCVPPALGYADDMALLSVGDPEQIKCQTTILNLWEKWTDQALNSNKTKILTTDVDSPWEVVNETSPNKTAFQKVNTFKYLGVIIHANPTLQASMEQQKLAHIRLSNAMQRLRKLRNLPLPTASKAAIIQSAVHTLVPYGVYAIPPKLMPTNHLQVLTNHVLKGGPKHHHMSNAIMQHPRIGEATPNITNDMPFLVVAELHRLLNTPNFTQTILKAYLKTVQIDMQWPHHPLDPATMDLRLHDHWKGSLIDIWRQWLTQTPQAARPSFVTTEPALNPGGWTNFFTSTRFDYNTTRINRSPWILPENLRAKFAKEGVYNYAQFTAIPSGDWHYKLTIQEYQQVRIHLQAQTFRCHMNTHPPLRNPWNEPKINLLGPWAANTTSAADGAATDHFMSAAWAAATKAQFRRKNATGIPLDQQAAQPVYGYLNSTWAETYALEGAVITALRAGLWSTTLHKPTEAEPDPPPGHAQDNKSCLDTLRKYMGSQHIPTGQFITTQQARPVWRRILTAKEQLTKFTFGWKKGHAQNWDINAVDCLTEMELHHRPLEEAEAMFPDLQILVEGMDEFALVLAFPVQSDLPIAHPCLPTPGHARTLRTTGSRNDPPSPWISMRHDGTRSQLHHLWTHLMANHRGHSSPTYFFMTHNINMKMAQEGLLLRQKGYWTMMKTPPRDGEFPPPIDSPLTGAERNLILHLRQGLWIVHTTDGTDPIIPSLRWCQPCKRIATLHHVLCDCTEPDMVKIRRHLINFCAFLKQPHPHLPNRIRCGQEHKFHGSTPTNLANTRWATMEEPRRTPKIQTSPACLHSWLGMYPQHTPRKSYHHRIHLATMHTTFQLIHQWMQMVQEKGEYVLHKSKCHIPTPAAEILATTARPPPPKLVRQAKQPQTRTKYQCTVTTCHTQTTHPGARCARHTTDAGQRQQTRLSHKVYNARANKRWITPATFKPAASWRPQSFIMISGAFAGLGEETMEGSDPPRNKEKASTTPKRYSDLRNTSEPNSKRRAAVTGPTSIFRRGHMSAAETRQDNMETPSHILPTRTQQPKRLRSPTKDEKQAWNHKCAHRKPLPPSPPPIPMREPMDTQMQPSQFGTRNISAPTPDRLLATTYLLRHTKTMGTPATEGANRHQLPSPPTASARKRPAEAVEQRQEEHQIKKIRMSDHKTSSTQNTLPNGFLNWGGEDPGSVTAQRSPTYNTKPRLPETSVDGSQRPHGGTRDQPE